MPQTFLDGEDLRLCSTESPWPTKNIGNPTLEGEVTLSPGIALNNTTSTTIVAADSTRKIIVISNDSNRKIWIKEQRADVDDDKKGIPLTAGAIYESPQGFPYQGEYSGIVDSGANVNVFVSDR